MSLVTVDLGISLFLNHEKCLNLLNKSNIIALKFNKII
jgi:hypothetical protein